jgi:hypothetical protein
MITVEKSPLVILGVKPQVVLKFTDYAVDGEGFILVLLNGDGAAEFGFVAGAPANAYQIRDNSDSSYAYVDDWVIGRVMPQLTTALTNYDITLVTGGASEATIAITGKVEGPQHNISLGDNGTADLVQLTTTLGVLGSNMVMARNPVEFEFSTDNNISTAGVKAYIDLIFAGLPSNNQTFTLTFLGRTITFTFKSVSIDDSGNQILIDGLSADFPANFVMPTLLNNFYLNQDYEIYMHSSTTVRIKALQSGVKYSITGTEAVTNMTLGTPVAGFDAVYRDGFRILADVFAETTYLSGDYQSVFGAEGIPDANGNCLFNFTDVLTGLPLKPQAPAFSPAAIFMLENCYRRFFVRATEWYSSAPRVSQRVPSEYLYYLAINGARKFLNLAQNINTDFAAAAKFLTLMPAEITCSKAQHQYLSLFIQQPLGVSLSLRLLYKLNYTDGSSGAWTAHTTLTGYNAKKIITFKVGFDQLALEASIASGKTVKNYQIKVDDGTTDLSEVRTFTLIEQRHQNRYFLFFNSFGLPETAFFHGQQKRMVEFEKVEVRMNRPLYNSTTDVYDGDIEQIYPEFKRGYELATGYKRKNYLEYFLDFMNSPKHYEQLADKYAAVSIGKQDMDLDTDKQRLYGLNLKYTDAFTERGNA